jgi:hypothetical protein
MYMLNIHLDYVGDIFKTVMSAIQDKTVIQDTTALEKAQKELNDMTPLPMHSMLEKQPRKDAISKQQARWSMDTTDVPPTNPG